MTTSGGRRKTAFDAEALLGKAAKLGCQQAEVYVAQSLSAPVAFENNRLKSVTTVESEVVAVRVVKDGLLGSATSARPGDSEVVEMAVRAAGFGPAAEFDFAPRAMPRADLCVSDDAVASWPEERMITEGEKLIDTVRALGDGVLGSVDLEKSTSSTRVATSQGQDVRSTGTAVSVSAVALLVEPDNMLWAFHGDRSRRMDLDFAAIGERVSWLYGHGRGNVRQESGSFPVIFAPGAGIDLMARVEACLDGRSVTKGESPWRDKTGQRLLAESFTLHDDPARPWGAGTAPFDDEGVPTARRTLIRAGVLEEFNLDLRSAKVLGARSTGNGFRLAPQSQPAPCPSNLVLEPGTASVAELIAGMEKGLYVAGLQGAWAGSPFTGQVAGNIVLGFRIEAGEVVGRVKDCMLAVNVFEAFRDQLVALGREVELDGVSVNAKA